MKIKELKKLAEEVQRASRFAEEIKNKVTTDLARINELDAFVKEVKETVLALEKRVEAANEVLVKLDELLS
jgi:peptidoglycan hydrolase CwlO-like protein